MTDATTALRLVDESRAVPAQKDPRKHPRDAVLAAALLFLPDDGTDWAGQCEQSMRCWESISLPSSDFAINEPACIALTAFDMMPKEYKEKRQAWHHRLRSVAGDRFFKYGKARGLYD
ncbi:MAG: hypothetical protein JNM32_10130 [Dechloromonas sp.]|nr:hypothetical protein [Dechloromonas sp.]